MINIILQDIVAYRVEVPLVWLLSLLLAFYKLGYQVSKRKHSQTSHQIQKLESIVPYRKDPPVKVVQKQKQPTELPFQQSQTSLKRAVSSTSEPVRQRKPEGQYMVSDLLKEKLDLQSKKLHSTSFLEIRIQPSNNLKYMRKIQKHELVTDYELQTQEISTNLIPFKNSPNVALAQPNSCLSVIARQDHTMKLMSPINQQHFVKMNYFGDFMKHKEITSWLTETGRFNKFYRRTKVVGKGGFGCVFRAENIYDQKEYAIKKIIIDGSVKLNQLLQQVSIISKYNHPNIVFYYTCWIQLSSLDQINQLSSYLQSKMHQKTQKASKIQSFDYISQDSGFQFEKISSRSKSRSSAKNKQSQMALVKPIPAKYVNLVNFNTLYIQMELCQGSLYEYLRSRKSLNFAEAFQIIAQLLLGIQFLHSNGVVHRDLKPGNILMNKNKSQVKIGDFGLATFIQSHSQNKMRNKVGTPLYMAPQLNSSVPVAKQNMHLVDIFSLGVIYYELLNEFNACTQHERYQKIHSLQQNNVSFASKQLKEQRKFIKLLTRNENTRPSILEVLQSTEFSILKAKYQI